MSFFQRKPKQPEEPKDSKQDVPTPKAPPVPPAPPRAIPKGGRPPVSSQEVPRPAPPASAGPGAGPPPLATPKVAPRPSSPGKALAESTLEELLAEAVNKGASDLHLTQNMPPMIRLNGRLIPLDRKPLSAPECEKMVVGMLNPDQKARFEKDWELDLSAYVDGIGRFRVNLHRQSGAAEAAIRVVRDDITPIRQLGLPQTVEELARKNSGLMMVTGPTGSGKTTTLAAIVDQINHERNCMIITVEDPVEYVHKNRRAVIKQREITCDTHSFVAALRHVLRQDPDVIVVGEMRDLETIQTALIAAETGHMVYSTLHTPDAVQTIDRIIDVFPPHHQDQTRIQLANTLQAVLAQQLIPMPGDKGRVVATELMIATAAVRKTIRTGKTEQLMTLIQTGHEYGMMSMDKSLKNLYLQGMVTFDDAITRCKYPESFDQI